MGIKMTLSSRAELTNAVRRRYSAAAGAEKRKILDEFIAVTGYHEKSAIRALNAEPTVRKRQTRARPSLYDEAVGACSAGAVSERAAARGAGAAGTIQAAVNRTMSRDSVAG